MKQFILTHKLLCIILACVVVVGAACAIVLPIALKHEHTFATEWTSDENNHWHKATCDHKDEKSGLAAHDFNDGEITAPATEEAVGVKTFTCKTCGFKKTEEIKKLEHTHKFATEWTSDETNHWHKATCEHTEETSELAAHTFGDWTTKTEADYGVDEVKERTCTVCGKSQEETVENSALAAKNNSVTVGTIEFTYNGESQPIDSLIEADNTEGMVIEYEGRSYTSYEKTETAPTDVGVYKYIITIPATAEWNAVEISGDFEIKRYFITEVEGKHSKEYNGLNVIDVKLDQTKYKGLSVQIYFTSKDVGSTVQRILVNGEGRNNYDVDQDKVIAEITPKKLSGLTITIKKSEIDPEQAVVTFTTKIKGVKEEEVNILLEFYYDDLVEEEELALALVLPDKLGTGKCKISLKDAANYELGDEIGWLTLEKEAA